MDYGHLEEVNQQIQAEPIEGLDREIRGLLASIGIEKGKEFNPDARMKEILTEAAKVGSSARHPAIQAPSWRSER
jgi:hypothetical protein